MYAFKPASGPRLAQQYQQKHHFGQNFTGGEIWLGHHYKTHQPVLMQTFVLPSQYREPILRSYQNRMALLLELEHPRVPDYLDAATEEKVTRDNPAGEVHFCTVQSFVPAKPLPHFSEVTPKQLKQFAQEVLGILMDLHGRSPMLLHGDLNPENIWLNDTHQAYLMNFALDLDLKRPLHRTSPFLAPEQRHGRKLRYSTDLYSLGMTLIHWVTGLSGEQLRRLPNASGNLSFQRHMPTAYSVELIRWLDTLVQADYHARFPDAETALAALKRIAPERKPKVRLRPAALVFKADKLDDVLHQTVILENAVPDTLLSGHWEIAERDRSWLRIDPLRFSGNRVKCRITINTRHLRGHQTLESQLQLQSNAEQTEAHLPIWVKTASFRSRHLPWPSLLLLSGLALLLSQWIAPLVQEFGLLGWSFWGAGALLGGYVGWAIAFSHWQVLFRASLLTGSLGAAIGALAGNPRIFDAGLMNYIVGVLAGALLLGMTSSCYQQHRKLGFIGSIATTIPLLTLIVSFVGGTWHRLAGLLPSLQLGLAWFSGLLCILVIGAELREFLRHGLHLWKQRSLIGAQSLSSKIRPKNVQVTGVKQNAGGGTAGEVLPGEHRRASRRPDRAGAELVGGSHRR